MYSLYRAWFGDSVTSDNYTRLQETLSPPDTVVRVGNEGEHQFVAHKGVLAAHSGYLKALLTSAATTPNQPVNTSIASCANLPATAIAVSANNRTTRQPVTSVSVSSIGGEAFAPLLNYMYTGRLEVTLDNVYSVLLATHLLHMPGALEQCRAALLRLRAPPPLPTPIPVPAAGPTSTLTSTSMSTSAPGTGNILRPIPNRLMIDPSMCWPHTTPLYPSSTPTAIGISHLPQLQPSVLMQSTVSHNVSVVPTPNIQETRTSTSYREVPSPRSPLYQLDRNRLRMDSRAKSPLENASSSSLPYVAAAAAFNAFTTSSSPCQSVSPTPSSISPCQSKKNDRQRQTNDEQDDKEHIVSVTKRRDSSPLIHVDETTMDDPDRNVESSSIMENDRGRTSRRRGRGSNTGNDGPSEILSVVYDVACCDGPVKFHRVLNENYSPTITCTNTSVTPSRLQRPCFEPENASSENDENGGSRDIRTSCDPIESEIDPTNSTGSYTCEYCRHTFKSQYCYRKHTKRHLLPTRMNETIGNRQRQENTRNRREVRLLDLNVQYYPCKICGCKFPSYYFVHKHKKLCHANAEERMQSDEANSTVTEDQDSTTSTTNNDRQ